MICCNCNQPFDKHTERADGNRECPDGADTFNFVFQANPEVIDFVKENLDKSPQELADMWIDRLRRKDRR